MTGRDAGPGRDDAPPGTLSYEQARAALDDVVRRLEDGAATLEDSLALWERGEGLAARCQELLDGALSRLDTGTGGAAPPAPRDADGDDRAGTDPGADPDGEPGDSARRA